MKNSIADWEEFLKQVQYRPGWTFRVEDDEEGGMLLIITATVMDAYRNDQTIEQAFLHRLAETSLQWEMIEELHRALEYIELHELGEFLVIDGWRPYNPHR